MTISNTVPSKVLTNLNKASTQILFFNQIIIRHQMTGITGLTYKRITCDSFLHYNVSFHELMASSARCPPPPPKNPSSWTKNIDSFGAPPFNLFAPFHVNDVLVQGEERTERERMPRRRGRGRYGGGGGS